MPAQWQLGQLVLSVSTLRAKVLSLQLLLNMAGILPTKGGQSVYFEVVLLLGFLDELVILVGTLEVAHHFLKQLLHWALNYLIYHNKRHKQCPQTIQFKKNRKYILTGYSHLGLIQTKNIFIITYLNLTRFPE